MNDGNHLLEAFTRFFEKHLNPIEYEWPVTPKAQAGLPDFQWHKKSGSAEESIELKHYLTKKWAVSDATMREQLARWLVVDWGKVKRNTPERIKSHVEKALDANTERPLEGVASYSKILSMVNCTQYAIYDARVAACLNAVQLQMQCNQPIFFPYIPSQNRHFKADNKIKNFVNTFSKTELVNNRGWLPVDRNTAYTTYLDLLYKLKNRFQEKEIYHFEMILFTQALVLCPKLVNEYSKFSNGNALESEISIEDKTKNYKEQVVEIVNNLVEARHIVFNQIVNFALSNEFSQINSAFDVGDVYNFSLVHFEDAKDTNLMKLIELCENIEQTTFTLMNLNGIEEDELNHNDEE